MSARRLSTNELIPGIGALLAAAALFVLPLVLGDGFGLLWTRRALITGLVVVGLNVVTGLAGAVSIGHIGIFAAGAYSVGYVTAVRGGPIWLGFVVAVLVGAAIGVALGWPSLRLHHWYFTLVTLGLAMVTPQLLIQWTGITGGYQGIAGIPSLTIAGNVLNPTAQYYVVLATFAAFTIGFALIKRSSLGFAFVAVKNDELMAEAQALPARRLKLLAFVMSSVPAAIGGALYAHDLRYISPDMFNLDLAIIFLLALVIGGSGMTMAPLVGTLTILYLHERLTWLKDVELLVYGTLLLVVLHLMPDGIVVAAKRLVMRSDTAEPAQAPDATDLTLGVVDRGPLHVAGISKSFGGVRAVDDVHLTVEPGTVHALIGPNGSGKTTVLNLVTGYYPLDDGEVRLGGKLISGLPAHAVASAGIVRTFQRPRLVEAWTLIDNIRLPARDRMRSQRVDHQARALLELVGLSELANEPTTKLTHGQRRLAEIARAVILEPGFLLLDEPGAGLSDEEVEQLDRLIVKVSELGTGVLVVEHNVPFVLNVATTITVIERGRIIASGEPEQIRNDPAVIEAYMGGRYRTDEEVGRVDR